MAQLPRMGAPPPKNVDPLNRMEQYSHLLLIFFFFFCCTREQQYFVISRFDLSLCGWSRRLRRHASVQHAEFSSFLLVLMQSSFTSSMRWSFLCFVLAEHFVSTRKEKSKNCTHTHTRTQTHKKHRHPQFFISSFYYS